MLAEKFFLYLEALIKSQQTHSDGSPRVISSSPHVPVRLPVRSKRPSSAEPIAAKFSAPGCADEARDVRA
jgi:hypothetical protein